MPFTIDKKLVVGVSSNALFDLTKEEKIFNENGLKSYREYQNSNNDVPLPTGPAYPFIKRFLNINNAYPERQPVEVVILSKNSPETGIRIMNSIKHYDINISRGAFISGDSPYKFIPSYNISLFLSKNVEDVTNAITAGYPAGRFINTSSTSLGDNSDELRVAFDFDGVIADDKAERIYQTKGIDAFYKHETLNALIPHNPGPLADFFKKLSFFQKLETKKQDDDPNYKKILKTAIITARNAPAHERAINTLKAWDVTVDNLFILGGIEKKRILETFKPHLFMDDQLEHLDPELTDIPLVHVPFGIKNISNDNS